MKLKTTLQLLILIITLLKLNHGLAQVQEIYKKFHPDTLKSVIAELNKELSLKHPGYYRYNSKEDFDLLIDSVQSTIVDSLSRLEAYKKLKYIISSIHCLHTELYLSEKTINQLNEQPNLFPFQLLFDKGKAFVIKNKSDNAQISLGDEILSINGQSINQITRQLLTLIPADGYNLTMKYRALFLSFPTWYRMIDPSSVFKIQVLQGDSIIDFEVKAKRHDQIAEEGFISQPTFDKQLAFEIEDETAFLTIHTFSKSTIKTGHQKFKKFIDKVFLEINKKDIKNLVVDLRDNTGGTDSYAAYFSRYFFDEPFRYWDRIEVTDSLAKEVKGLVKLFFRKPIAKDGRQLWQKGKLTKEFDYFEEQKPAKNNYQGNTYLLINGFCMSSCADVAAILSHNNKALTLGQETGGGYQGNSSGMIPQTEVKPFGFGLSVPLNNYFNAVDSSVNFGRGTIPEHTVIKDAEAILSGKDIALLKVKELIETRRD